MDYLQQSKTILSDCLGVPFSKIKADSTLEALKPGLDSITFVSIMIEVEKRAGNEIPVTEWLELETTTDLARILERNSRK